MPGVGHPKVTRCFLQKYGVSSDGVARPDPNSNQVVFDVDADVESSLDPEVVGAAFAAVAAAIEKLARARSLIV